jgi:hypothetical protein
MINAGQRTFEIAVYETSLPVLDTFQVDVGSMGRTTCIKLSELADA